LKNKRLHFVRFYLFTKAIDRLSFANLSLLHSFTRSIVSFNCFNAVWVF
jgi:hypothetical protein